MTLVLLGLAEKDVVHATQYKRSTLMSLFIVQEVLMGCITTAGNEPVYNRRKTAVFVRKFSEGSTLDANNAGFAGDVKDPGMLDLSRTCHTGMLYIGTHLDPP